VFTPQPASSANRNIAYGLMVFAALTMMKLGLIQIPIGIGLGMFISWNWRLMHDGDDMALGWALLWLGAGGVLVLGAAMLAHVHGVAFFDVKQVPGLGRNARNLPFTAILVTVAGVFLILEHLCLRLVANRAVPDD
jgi:hypothetical protein